MSKFLFQLRRHTSEVNPSWTDTTFYIARLNMEGSPYENNIQIVSTRDYVADYTWKSVVITDTPMSKTIPETGWMQIDEIVKYLKAVNLEPAVQHVMACI